VQAVEVPVVAEVLGHRELRVEARALEDHPQAHPHRARLVGQIPAQHPHGSPGRRHEGGEDLEEGRLAASIRPEETKDLSAGYGKGDAGERFPSPVQVTQVLDLDGGNVNSRCSFAYHSGTLPRSSGVSGGLKI